MAERSHAPTSSALPVGTRIDRYTVDQIYDRPDPFRFMYGVHDADTREQFIIDEFFPAEFVARKGHTMRPLKEDAKRMILWGLRGFADQATGLMALHHPALVPITRVFESNDTVYCVSRYSFKESLLQRIEREGQLGADILLPLIDTLVDALSCIHHAGLMHWDVRPHNIVLDEIDYPGFIGFGSARHVMRFKCRSLANVLTSGYSPPEVYVATAQFGPATDLYSLAATAYHAIAGMPPPDALKRQRGEAKMKSAVDVGEDRYPLPFLKALDWALQVDPHQRPQTAAEWREALAAAGSAAPTIAEEETAEAEEAPPPAPAPAPAPEKLVELRQAPTPPPAAPSPPPAAVVEPEAPVVQVPTTPAAATIATKAKEPERIERQAPAPTPTPTPAIPAPPPVVVVKPVAPAVQVSTSRPVADSVVTKTKEPERAERPTPPPSPAIPSPPPVVIAEPVAPAVQTPTSRAATVSTPPAADHISTKAREPDRVERQAPVLPPTIATPPRAVPAESAAAPIPMPASRGTLGDAIPQSAQEYRPGGQRTGLFVALGLAAVAAAGVGVWYTHSSKPSQAVATKPAEPVAAQTPSVAQPSTSVAAAPQQKPEVAAVAPPQSRPRPAQSPPSPPPVASESGLQKYKAPAPGSKPEAAATTTAQAPPTPPVQTAPPAPPVQVAQPTVSHAPSAAQATTQAAPRNPQREAQKAVESPKAKTVAAAPAPAPVPAPQPVAAAPQKTVVHVAPVLNAKKNCRQPDFPSDVLRMNETSSVVITFMVDLDGSVKNPQVAASSGHTILDKAAIKALSSCKFVPGTADGVPEEASTKIKYSFRGS